MRHVLNYIKNFFTIVIMQLNLIKITFKIIQNKQKERGKTRYKNHQIN